MANMSYCRFQNTWNDLSDCVTALEEVLNGEEKLSREELFAARRMVTLCRQIAEVNVEDLEVR